MEVPECNLKSQELHVGPQRELPVRPLHVKVWFRPTWYYRRGSLTISDVCLASLAIVDWCAKVGEKLNFHEREVVRLLEVVLALSSCTIKTLVRLIYCTWSEAQLRVGGACSMILFTDALWMVLFRDSAAFGTYARAVILSQIAHEVGVRRGLNLMNPIDVIYLVHIEQFTLGSMFAYLRNTLNSTLHFPSRILKNWLQYEPWEVRNHD